MRERAARLCRVASMPAAGTRNDSPTNPENRQLSRTINKHGRCRMLIDKSRSLSYALSHNLHGMSLIIRGATGLHQYFEAREQN